MNYGSPSPDFLAQVNQTLTGGPAPTGPVMLGAPPVAPPVDAPIGPPLPPPPDAVAPAPAPVPMPAPVEAPQPQGPVPVLRQLSAGGVVNVPGREVDMRGPTLQAAQAESNAAFAGAVEAVKERSAQTAAADYAVALEQERKAGIRQEAAQYTAAERADELAQRQADFDASTKAMADAGTIDQSRFFTSASAGGKLAMLVGLFVGGLAEAKGARNTGAEAIIRLANQDIEAQKFAYFAAKDRASAKQTAFSMAMQKYNNVDAATAAARAASMDVIAAQAAKSAASWRHADSDNRASLLTAEAAKIREQQAAHFFAYAAPKQVAIGPTFVDRNGLRYSEAEAKGIAKDMRTQEGKLGEIEAKAAGDLVVEREKAEVTANADRAKHGREFEVELPSGDVVRARNSTEVTKLSKLSASVTSAQALVNEAKEIRKGNAWRVPFSEDERRLQSIQSELTLSFKDRGELGALSGPDMGLALAATGDITSMAPNAGARLDSFAKHTNGALTAYVKTIPGAPNSAKGKPPESFRPEAKGK